MSKLSDKELLDALGVEATAKKKTKYTVKEERVIAGFEDIQRFVEEHGHIPQHGEDKDIFERLYAVRLDRIREQTECVTLLQEFDHQDLLKEITSESSSPEPLNDEDLLNQLGVSKEKSNELTELKHVKPKSKVRSPEEVAERKPCKDFDRFKPLFKQIQSDLDVGVREARVLKKHAKVNKGDCFILYGQKAYVADVGKEFITEYHARDARLKVIYDNGTESNLLLRSLQKALAKDLTSRRIVTVSDGPLFNSTDLGTETGTIYVLRSKSNHPTVEANRTLIHKIGVTGDNVKNRIRNASKDPTFLMDEVEIVSTYKLFDINRVKLERLIHRFLHEVRMDINIIDRFGKPVIANEWFLVPIYIIDEIIEKVKDGSLWEYTYDPNSVKIVKNERKI